MGVIQSIPLCSRTGEPVKPESEVNNNESMPSQEPQKKVVVVSQPSSSGIVNPNADLTSSDPNATSTPKEGKELRFNRESPSAASESSSSSEIAGIHGGGNRSTAGGRDSGLDQSSSADDTEDDHNVNARRPQTRNAGDLSDEGVLDLTNALGQSTDNLQVHRGGDLTEEDEYELDASDSEDDDHDDDTGFDPVERPPEPTVPDERVDTDDDLDGDGGLRERLSRIIAQEREEQMVTQKPGGDTARAFTAMLDDIIQDAETMEKEDLQLSGGGVNTLKMGHHRQLEKQDSIGR